MTECDTRKLIDEFIKRTAVCVPHQQNSLYEFYGQETPRLSGRDRDVLFSALPPSLLTLQRQCHVGGHGYASKQHSDLSESSFESSFHSSNCQSSSRPVSIEKSSSQQNSPTSRALHTQRVNIDTPPQSPPVTIPFDLINGKFQTSSVEISCFFRLIFEIFSEIKEVGNEITTLNYMCIREESRKQDESQQMVTSAATCEQLVTPPLKPTRPYSYYVATNFHPFDLSVLCQQLEEKKQQEKEATVAKSPVGTLESVQESATRSNKRTKKQKKQKQRLSMSLGDIKTSNSSKLVVNDNEEEDEFKLSASKKAKSNQLVNNVAADDEAAKFSTATVGRNCGSSFFKRATGLTSTMPAFAARAHKFTRSSQNQSELHHQQPHQPITGKINRFFRQLFRVGDKHVPSTIDEEVLNKTACPLYFCTSVLIISKLWF